MCITSDGAIISSTVSCAPNKMVQYKVGQDAQKSKMTKVRNQTETNHSEACFVYSAAIRLYLCHTLFSWLKNTFLNRCNVTYLYAWGCNRSNYIRSRLKIDSVVFLYTPVSPSVSQMEGIYATGGILFLTMYLWWS